MLMLVIMVVIAAMVMIMVMLLMLMEMLHLLFQNQILMLHSSQNLLAFQFIPRSGNDGSLRVLLFQHLYSGIQLVLGHFLSTAHNDGSCVLYLVVKELTEVLHIHFALLSVHNGDGAVQFHRLVSSNTLYSLRYVRKFANT